MPLTPLPLITAPPFTLNGARLTWTSHHQTLQIDPWGADGARVRATCLAEVLDLPGGLLPQPGNWEPALSPVEIHLDQASATWRHGKLRLQVSLEGQLSAYQAESGGLLLTEEAPHFTRPPARWFRPHPGSDNFYIEVRFDAQDNEHFYGLGQHQHGRLDQKGCIVELMQRNTEVCIPFLLSSRGYGLLWNTPALGRVELGHNGTRWVANSARQVDYYLVAGDTPAAILARYADATGHAPLLPEYAAGFWQCKLRYKTQSEVLQVAREYKQRGLPLSIIVVDFFHWTRLGEFRFDPLDWPDPAGMVRELDALGVRLMVSIWPTINRMSAHYDEMVRRGLLLRSERGHPVHMAHLPDTYPPLGPAALTFYDPSHPEARSFVWERVKQGYFDHGIRLWWLDACEPELQPMDHDAVRYHIGSGPEVGLLYPLLHQQAFWDGMRREGESEVLSLCRSAYAGSQRYGAAVWSGDIASTFESLRRQLPAGLNIGMSGIPWWTTDIGGFYGGATASPDFHELLVRWFQFGVFCPLFRLHGNRDPSDIFLASGGVGSGADNEVWSFGEPVYSILASLLHLRERLRPYIMDQMRTASQHGLPPMRSLFLEFPADSATREISDQFLLGPDLLVAPVLHAGARARRLYLPAGADWQDAWTGEVFPGGAWIERAAPLELVPAYWRLGSPSAFNFG